MYRTTSSPDKIDCQRQVGSATVAVVVAVVIAAAVAAADAATVAVAVAVAVTGPAAAVAAMRLCNCVVLNKLL